MSNPIVSQYYCSGTYAADKAAQGDSLDCGACGQSFPGGEAVYLARRPLCPACVEDVNRASEDPATLASQSGPRPDCGIGAALFDMFANTYRPLPD